MSMKQNDAVFNAVCAVLKQESFDGAVKLNKEQAATVINIVAEGIDNGEVAFSEQARNKYTTFDLIVKYTRGMVDNHLRKDKRLNGGIKYEIQNPGIRASSGDATLKALKQLQKITTNEDDLQSIAAAIERREIELKTAKVKEVKINTDALPEEFRHLVK